MAHRQILTDKQRQKLLNIPTSEHDLLQHYVLSNEDLYHVNTKRKAANRLGFALQLCAFRYPGRLLQRKEVIPQQVLIFLAKQLGISADELATYGFDLKHVMNIHLSYNSSMDSKSFKKLITKVF